MARIRVSTTVDESLLEHGRRLRSNLKDAALLDEALGALVARHRAAEIDAEYTVYDDHPLDEVLGRPGFVSRGGGFVLTVLPE